MAGKETYDNQEEQFSDVESRGDWQKRHDEIEEQREQIRNRVRSTKAGNAVLRPAKPKPTISDSDEKNVGVYARVSTKSTEQTSSIENQSLYYTKKVEDTPNWTLHEIYSDEGKSGTSTQHRTEFNRMLQDAADKKIDLILCASVSRFARNMSDCMTLIRQLKSTNPSHPVGVYFETENIYTLDPDCNQSLSVHAMLADWESANKSRRMILSYDQRICTGQYPVCDLLGYRHTKDGELIIQPEEAKTVRFIFLAYILGYDSEEIAEILTEKERPTLKGRTEWTAGMVRSIMNNERRWGDLEARKTIVIDYVEHKSKKNEDDRVSAYQEGHHEGIVTPEIAKAARLVTASSRTLKGGVADMVVIPNGILKGFVSVCPAWGGISHDAVVQVCKDAYEAPELKQLEREIRIWSGEEQSKILSMNLTGYEVPHGIFFLNQGMPSLTVKRRSIKFNKACHKKLGFCKYVEVLYHPILQTVVIREAAEDTPNRVEWEKEDGAIVGAISTPAFTDAVYENLNWKQEYSFKFRGITKERGIGKIIIFALDEPQILIPAKEKKRLQELGEWDENQQTRYIKYRNEPDENTSDTRVAGIDYAYPEQWKKNPIGMSYAIRRQRDNVINRITEKDILQNGVLVENPMIGHIPTKDEIRSELEELLMTM